MVNTMKSTAGKFIILVLLLALLAEGVTVAVAYAVTQPPRSMLVWIAITFLCVIELVAALLAINVFARSRTAHRPSGAVMAGMWRALGIYLVLGGAAIGLYALLRDEQGARDTMFAGLFAALTAIFFIAATAHYGFDLLSEAHEQPIQQTRADHENLAISLLPTLSMLRNASFEDPALLDHRLKLVKRIESIDAALRHSHGGGAGSWEHGRQPQSLVQKQEIQAAGITLSVDVEELAQARDVETARAIMNRMTSQVVRMESAIDALGLA